MNNTFYPEFYIDLETTGLNPNEDKICQVGALLPNGEEIDTLINPGRPISQATTVPLSYTQLTLPTNREV